MHVSSGRQGRNARGVFRSIGAMQSAIRTFSVLAVLIGVGTACQTTPRMPGRDVNVTDQGRLAELNPSDIAVLPIEVEGTRLWLEGNPILLADNEPGAYYGAFCLSCHNGTAPAEAALGTGGVAATDVYDYAEATNDGTETKHPTFTNDGGGFDVVGCNNCHDVHSTGTDHGHLLMANNDN